MTTRGTGGRTDSGRSVARFDSKSTSRAREPAACAPALCVCSRWRRRKSALTTQRVISSVGARRV